MFQNSKELPPLQGPYNVSQQAIDSILPDSMTIGHNSVQFTPASVSLTARPPSNGSFSGAVSFLNLFGPAAALPAANPTAVAVTDSGAILSHATAAVVQEDRAPDAAPEAEAQELLNERIHPFEFDIFGASAYQRSTVPVPATLAPAAVPAVAPSLPAAPLSNPVLSALPGAATGPSTPALSAPAASLVPDSSQVTLAVPAPMIQV